MLHFFRKYQRIFFLIITVVIVISFSFFGTYSSMVSPPVVDQDVFVALDGSVVKRSEIEEMALFIGTDQRDKLVMGGVWGPNFLNDGVVEKDFLETGLGAILAGQYRDLLVSDYQIRSAREKRYQPYRHAQVEQISVENIWKTLMPAMEEKFLAVKEAQDPLKKENFEARSALYSMERQLPAPSLRQILRYQNQQFPGIPYDPALDQVDLALFGYHTVEDWFGAKFVRLVAAFIINGAKVAEQKGYTVSDAEALAALQEQTRVSFEQVKNSPYLGVNTPSAYLRQQLRYLNMDQAEAVQIEKKILLFRRLFQGAGDAVFVDVLPYKKMAEYANAYVQGELYQLPQALRIASLRDMAKLEIYLDGVSKREEESLDLPTKYLPVSEVIPELVEKKYKIEMAHMDRRNLETKVTVKEMWDWEMSDKGWEKLGKAFPELAQKENRKEALDKLSQEKRTKVNAFAREEMVKEKPEWIAEAIAEAPKKTIDLHIRKSGGHPLFPGLEKNSALIKKLDEASQVIESYSPDQRNYYRITVLEKSPDERIVLFAEAASDGTLDRLLDKKLGKQKAEEEYSTLLAKIKEKTGTSQSGEKTASLRLFTWMQKAFDEVKKGKEDKWVAKDSSSLDQQWKLEKSPYKAHQGETSPHYVDKKTIFSKEIGAWVPVKKESKGDLSFFHLQEKGTDPTDSLVAEGVTTARQKLSHEAQRALMQELLEYIQLNREMTLDYLTTPSTPA